MLRKNSVIAVLLGNVLTSLPAPSQESPLYKADASVQMAENAVKTTVDNSVPQSATSNGGILGGYEPANLHASGVSGSVYNSPAFDLPELNGTDRLTHSAEPSLGFGYRF